MIILQVKFKILVKIKIRKKMLPHQYLQTIKINRIFLNLRMTKMKIFLIKQKEIKSLIVHVYLLSSRKK
jgi:hypothetical protein